MKKITFLAVLLGITQLLSAQSYSLSEITSETFKTGGNAQWSFEKFGYQDGLYAPFSLYSNQCAANYLDWWNPERLEGNRITEIPGSIADYAGTSYMFLLADNLRYGWCDLECTSANQTSADNNEQTFCYVARDDREEFGYELYANGKYTSVVTFTVPADGYYVVYGIVEREDCVKSGPLSFLPRYRYATDENQNYVDPSSTMGVSFAYGASEGDQAGYSGGCNLAGGAVERLIHQTPVEFSLGFRGKKGDKISFEPNVASTGLTNNGWARTFWARTFVHELTVDFVDEATALAETYYIDPYGAASLDNLLDLYDKVQEAYSSMEIQAGTAYGNYSAEAISAFESIFIAIGEAMDSESINMMNANVYLQKLQNAWDNLLASMVQIDFITNGLHNYRLFYMEGGEKKWNAEALAVNDGNPWNYCFYTVNEGSYTEFPNHDKNSKYDQSDKADMDCWYASTGDWLFISDKGYVHPSTSKSPAFVFTSPAEHVYKVEVAVTRRNPGSQDFAEYLMGRYRSAETAVCPKDNYFLRKPYGAKTGSNFDGRDTLNVEMFVHLKEGDRMSFEVECYTAGKDASCGTEVVRMVVCACLNADTPFTEDSAAVSGLEFFNPYKVADMTNLRTAVADANSFCTSIVDLIAEPDDFGKIPEGMYDATVVETLKELLATADGYLQQESAGIYTQVEVDNLMTRIQNKVEEVKASRSPLTFEVPDGCYTIRAAGTEYRFTQKTPTSDAEGTYYYMNFWNLTQVVNDANSNANGDLTAYGWDWTIQKQTLSVTDVEGQTSQVSFYTINNERGFVRYEGYVRETTTALTEANYLDYAFRFVKNDLADENVAIQRLVDGKYWLARQTWASPYDNVVTSTTPEYVFTLDPAVTPQRVEQPADVKTVAETIFYSLNGVRLSAPQKGLTIRVTVFADGTKEWKKVIVR